jgi:predicted nucleotidyltransferase
MSKPRTPSFGREQRSRLAKRAATARWARLGRGVLTLAEIRAAVVKALAEREIKIAAGVAEVPGRSLFKPPAPGERVVKNPRMKSAWLIGSYARGDAHARSNLNIVVVVEEMPRDLLGEIADLSSGMHEALGEGVHKDIDLLLVDEKTFAEHKAESWGGSPYHEAHREGIRLA